MDQISVDDAATGGQVGRSGLSDPLGTTDLAINRYRVLPGEGLPAGLHAHADQEEVFVVREGVARFETLREDDGEWTAETVAVAAGEAIRFAPGEFQSGHNAGDDDLVVLALGAPRDGDDVCLPVACRACGRGTLRLDTDGGLSFRCPDCDRAHVPTPCPDCGSDDLRVTLRDEVASGSRTMSGDHPGAAPASETLVVCSDCGATFARPPLST